MYEVKRLSLPVRAELLRLLGSESRVRADLIRQMYERSDTRKLAELLIDLEADPGLRLSVMEVLKDLTPPAFR